MGCANSTVKEPCEHFPDERHYHHHDAGDEVECLDPNGSTRHMEEYLEPVKRYNPTSPARPIIKSVSKFDLAREASDVCKERDLQSRRVISFRGEAARPEALRRRETPTTPRSLSGRRASSLPSQPSSPARSSERDAALFPAAVGTGTGNVLGSFNLANNTGGGSLTRTTPGIGSGGSSTRSAGAGSSGGSLLQQQQEVLFMGDGDVLELRTPSGRTLHKFLSANLLDHHEAAPVERRSGFHKVMASKLEAWGFAGSSSTPEPGSPQRQQQQQQAASDGDSCLVLEDSIMRFDNGISRISESEPHVPNQQAPPHCNNTHVPPTTPSRAPPSTRASFHGNPLFVDAVAREPVLPVPLVPPPIVRQAQPRGRSVSHDGSVRGGRVRDEVVVPFGTASSTAATPAATVSTGTLHALSLYQSKSARPSVSTPDTGRAVVLRSAGFSSVNANDYSATSGGGGKTISQPTSYSSSSNSTNAAPAGDAIRGVLRSSGYTSINDVISWPNPTAARNGSPLNQQGQDVTAVRMAAGFSKVATPAAAAAAAADGPKLISYGSLPPEPSKAVLRSSSVSNNIGGAIPPLASYDSLADPGTAKALILRSSGYSSVHPNNDNGGGGGVTPPLASYNSLPSPETSQVMLQSSGYSSINPVNSSDYSCINPANSSSYRSISPVHSSTPGISSGTANLATHDASPFAAAKAILRGSGYATVNGAASSNSSRASAPIAFISGSPPKVAAGNGMLTSSSYASVNTLHEDTLASPTAAHGGSSPRRSNKGVMILRSSGYSTVNDGKTAALPPCDSVIPETSKVMLVNRSGSGGGGGFASFNNAVADAADGGRAYGSLPINAVAATLGGASGAAPHHHFEDLSGTVAPSSPGRISNGRNSCIRMSGAGDAGSGLGGAGGRSVTFSASQVSLGGLSPGSSFNSAGGAGRTIGGILSAAVLSGHGGMIAVGLEHGGGGGVGGSGSGSGVGGSRYLRTSDEQPAEGASRLSGAPQELLVAVAVAPVSPSRLTPKREAPAKRRGFAHLAYSVR